PLLIANCDQILDWNSNQFIKKIESSEYDGLISTFDTKVEGYVSKWSHVKLDNDSVVIEVAEKVPISDIATTGIYYWKHGCDFVKYAQQMIEKDIQVNGEYYVCPVFNEATQDGKK